MAEIVRREAGGDCPVEKIFGSKIVRVGNVLGKCPEELSGRKEKCPHAGLKVSKCSGIGYDSKLERSAV